MINLKSKKTLAVLGLLPILGLAGCQMDSAVVSSGGRSFTVSPETPGASSSAPASSRPPSSPAAPSSPAPTVTVTDTPAPLPTPSATVQAATTDVSTCLPPVLAEADLNALATQAQARTSLADCLQIPAANQGEFTTQLALYALASLQAGEFRTDAGRHAWVGSDSYVALPDGRTVYSLTQITNQYG